MPQDRLTIQPGQIRLRHIRLKRPGEATGVSEATIMGKTYVASWDGINGPRGFQEGSYERRLNSEGQFSLSFLNAAGEDGVLHRERFLITQTGSRIPGNTFYAYGGGNYRPGDEWFEIWRGDPPTGDLLFVGTPTRAQVTQGTIAISGVDAIWLGRKFRDDATGFWRHAPRDVIEFYNGGWQTIVGEDFGTGSPDYTDNTHALVTTADGRFVVQNVTTDQANHPGVLRMTPGAIPNAFAYLRSAATIATGPFTTQPVRSQAWRVEASIVIGGVLSGESVECGLRDFGAGSSGVAIILGANGVVSLQSSGWGVVAQKPLVSLGRIVLAVEGREQCVFYYINGQLWGVLPYPTTAMSAAQGYLYYGAVSPAAMDVDYFLFRRTQPFLLRVNNSGGGLLTDPGSYTLGGNPPPGGLRSEEHTSELQSL